MIFQLYYYHLLEKANPAYIYNGLVLKACVLSALN